MSVEIPREKIKVIVEEAKSKLIGIYDAFDGKRVPSHLSRSGVERFVETLDLLETCNPDLVFSVSDVLGAIAVLPNGDDLAFDIRRIISLGASENQIMEASALIKSIVLKDSAFVSSADFLKVRFNEGWGVRRRASEVENAILKLQKLQKEL